LAAAANIRTGRKKANRKIKKRESNNHETLTKKLIDLLSRAKHIVSIEYFTSASHFN